MRRGIRGVATALLALTFGVAWRVAPAPLSLAPESRLWFDGKSTVRNFTCHAKAIEGAIGGEGAAAITAVLKGERSVNAATLTFPTAKLDCDNNTMNGHMLRALNATQHPNITFALTNYALAPTTAKVAGTLEGTLTINGVPRSITLPADFVAAGTALRVTGSYALKMTEWNVVPPKLMLGTLKVNEMVTVNFDLQLNP